MQIDDVRRIAVIGAGTMGQQIAFQCAGHGYDVVVYDVAGSPRLVVLVLGHGNLSPVSG